MSSSIDWFECPKCGRETASRDQDNQTCEVHYSCKCGWRGENVDDNDKRPGGYTKIINGYVAQNFELVSGEYVCTGQAFIAGDQVTREDDYGEPIDTSGFQEPEVYCPMEMKQPE